MICVEKTSEQKFYDSQELFRAEHIAIKSARNKRRLCLTF